MAEDKGELLQSLRIERSDAVPKPAPCRRLLVWISVSVAVAAAAGSVGVVAFPSSKYGQLGSSAYRQLAAAAPRYLGIPLSLRRQEAQVSVIEASEASPPLVAEAPVSTGLVASGYVVARRKATVAAEVTAKVVDVLVHEGMAVKKGDVLARLNSVLAERDLALARSRADSAEAAIGAVAADLQDAERIMHRNLRLRQAQVVSEAELTKSEARVGMLRAQLKQSQAAFETAQQDTRRAGEALDQYTIRAPFDGVVVERDAQPGEMISPLSVGGFTRTGICTLVDMESLEVDVDINETFIGRIRPGMQISAVLDTYPDWTIPASVIDIAPEANREKGTVKVRIGLKTKDPRILLDMAVKVSFKDKSAATDASARKFAAAN
jgi:HlyD family secretion protein